MFYYKYPTEWPMANNGQVLLWDVLTKAVSTEGSCRHFLEIPAHFASSLKAEDKGKSPLQTASLDGTVIEKGIIGFSWNVLKGPTI